MTTATTTKPTRTVRNRHVIEQERIKRCEQDAARNFANHTVRPLFVGMLPPAQPFCGTNARAVNPSEYAGWRCRNPGSWADGFDLYHLAGSLVITGDRGELIVERARDMFAWCRDSIHSIDYFASKVPSDVRDTKEFDGDMVRGWLNEIDAGDYDGCRYEEVMRKVVRDEVTGKFKKNDSEARDDLESAIERGETAVYEVLYQYGLCDDPPDFRIFTYSFLHQREAIKWFLRWYYGNGKAVPA